MLKMKNSVMGVPLSLPGGCVIFFLRRVFKLHSLSEQISVPRKFLTISKLARFIRKVQTFFNKWRDTKLVFNLVMI